MTDLLAAVLIVVLLVALACSVAALVLVAPFVVCVDMAERRRFSADRWGALALGAAALTLLLLLLLHAWGWSRVLYLPAAALAWAPPALLALIAPGAQVGGTQGEHER